MSYEWHEETKLMTCPSLLLQALEGCGLLDTNQSQIMTRVREARAAVEASEGKAKISALKQLKALLEEINAESTLPEIFRCKGQDFNFDLRYNHGRYIAGEYDEQEDGWGRRNHEAFLEFIPKIEEKYSELEKELLGDYDAVIEKLRLEIDEENMRRLSATVRAEREEANREEIALHQAQREQYLDSIERRKRIAEEEIMKNSIKIGFKVKMKKIGKKVQFLCVKR